MEDSSSQLVCAPSENAARCWVILLGDKKRCGQLSLNRVDSLIEKRDLDFEERAWVYRQLGLEINNEESLEDSEISTAIKATHADPVTSETHLGFRVLPALLTLEEEQELSRTIRNGKRFEKAISEGIAKEEGFVLGAIKRGQKAYQHMVLANLRLVASIAKAYQGSSSHEYSDLIQEGTIGLLKAAERFDPLMGAKFSTYAGYWIKQSIQRAIHDTGRAIRFPVHMAEKVLKLKRAINRLQNTSSEISIKQLADSLGWDQSDTEEVYAYAQMSFASFEDEGKSDGGGSLEDILRDSGISPEESAAKQEMNFILEDMMKTALNTSQIEILKRRFGFEIVGGDEETLEQIGHDYGLTRERIRQIEFKALKKMRHPSRLRILLSYRQE